ncbi:unnamed protein product [Polarella glacialis]|uniref:Uncharacterized protein n=1 Tax=Polarella glacialis TaxID=89957 RepID=A0A813GLL1_POLGL|nr:unnamed protein product [Polarella glacialis]
MATWILTAPARIWTRTRRQVQNETADGVRLLPDDRTPLPEQEGQQQQRQRRQQKDQQFQQFQRPGQQQQRPQRSEPRRQLEQPTETAHQIQIAEAVSLCAKLPSDSCRFENDCEDALQSLRRAIRSCPKEMRARLLEDVPQASMAATQTFLEVLASRRPFYRAQAAEMSSILRECGQ